MEFWLVDPGTIIGTMGTILATDSNFLIVDHEQSANKTRHHRSLLNGSKFDTNHGKNETHAAHASNHRNAELPAAVTSMSSISIRISILMVRRSRITK